ncbi:hypothetical protein [Quisquiliibacterium transsilvanicum]|jgi:hypothetical protein|uniref:Uncharacterized protein n=1 Tax=Quisquiliibacterium transsilvanicum TaxID=1549638 RepID=A0A7W8MA45_9BURK|nr:hypothetical protein [Quisquiliibacterium transsilvanicum]MBB5273297.1 hypothetical protein [Quisquiliibacterium transsilvanicum]
MSQSAVDLEAAWRAPAEVFARPEDVVAHAALSQEQKIEILMLWEHDVVEQEQATDAGMPGGMEGDLLRRILLALEAMTAGASTGDRAPARREVVTRRRPAGGV